MRRTTRGWLLVLVVIGLVVAGCGSDSKADDTTTTSTTTGGQETSTPESAVTGPITVSAAASLTEAFTKIGADFTAANPGATVTFNFGSSGTLATQIEQGARADTFASADEASMKQLVDGNRVVGQPVVFATNQLVIVTKPGNPHQIKTLADLAGLDVVALCGATVPCGKYAAQILEKAKVTIPEDHITRGQDVKATLGAVTTGDADAAIVYVTDAKSAGSAVSTVTIPKPDNVTATYPIATLRSSNVPGTSQAFIAYLTSDAGQATLRSFGFLPPS